MSLKDQVLDALKTSESTHAKLKEIADTMRSIRSNYPVPVKKEQPKLQLIKGGKG